MDAEQFVGRILDDEGIAGDLDESLSMPLIEWLVGRATNAVATAKTEDDAETQVAAIAITGRNIAKVVAAWQTDGPTGAATTAKDRGCPVPPGSLKSAADVLKWLQTQVPTQHG